LRDDKLPRTVLAIPERDQAGLTTYDARDADAMRRAGGGSRPIPMVDTVRKVLKPYSHLCAGEFLSLPSPQLVTRNQPMRRPTTSGPDA
jgi:hypothetical protein